MTASLLIALPSGLITSGVATWAVRLCNALAARGRFVGIILHAPSGGYRPLAMSMDPRVQVTDLSQLPPLEESAGTLEQFLPHYERAIAQLLAAGGESVVMSPNLTGDCYGLAAACLARFGPRLRIVGWLHNDIPYEYHVQRHYERAISRFVPVSRCIEATLKSQLPSRAAEITRVPYGVAVPPLASRNAAMSADSSLRPVRVIYAGRLNHEQKRIMALPAMCRALGRMGVAHELLIVGDGPAHAELAKACEGLRTIVRHSAVDPSRVLSLLEHADIFVLPSRYEGLSIAVMEALSRGCVPVVARTASGAAELLEGGADPCGALVDVPPDASDKEVGAAMASAIEQVVRERTLVAMSAAAHARASERFSIRVHADAVETLIDSVSREPARVWPVDVPWSFSKGGGSVRADGPDRLAHVLRSLKGKRIAVHGTGRHTLELENVFRECATLGEGDSERCRIVAFVDDDPAAHGRVLWGIPIVAPTQVSSAGATDVLISSWINQSVIYARRSVYESQGLAVHCVY